MSIDKGESSMKRELDEDGGLHKGWLAALATLLSARLEMICIEGKSASSLAASKLAVLVVALFGLLSAWVLALAAAIGAIAASTSWKWYDITFLFAGVHVMIGVILLLAMKSGKKISFPVTRAEFDKDREWLERLKNR